MNKSNASIEKASEEKSAFNPQLLGSLPRGRWLCWSDSTFVCVTECEYKPSAAGRNPSEETRRGEGWGKVNYPILCTNLTHR